MKKHYKKTYKHRGKKIKIILKITAGFLMLFAIFLAGLFIMFFKDLPRPEKFSEGLFAQSTKIYDRTGAILLYEIAGAEKRTLVPLSKIPKSLQQAVLTAEDRGFYEHSGLDFKAILRALLYDLKIGEPAQGASTISQQLIRSYFLTQQKTLKRKSREVILALELERRYNKDQIFEWYLNLIPFGSNLYGVQAASNAFFDKDVSEITLAESAILATIIRATTFLSPYGEHLDSLMNIQQGILVNMEKVGYISEEELQLAMEEEIKFAPPLHSMLAPHFVMFVKGYLENKYSRSYLEKAGLKVITTIDFDLQNKAEEIIKQNIEQSKVFNANNAGLVALNPKNGQILAMVGSKDYFAEPFPDNCNPGIDCLFDPQVNVTLANRQPGSAFKPFAYLGAFQKGYSPDTLIWDVQTEFNASCDPDASQKQDKHGLDCYHPRNYTGRFIGLIDFRTALAQSRNLPSVKVLYLAGIEETISLAKKLGISTLTDSSRYGLSLVLGGGEVKPLEMAVAYSVFANDGVKNPLTFILEIKDSNGKIFESAKNNPLKVFASDMVRKLNDVLSDNAARAPMFGWNSYLYIPNYDTAVKTGTTQKNNDAWAVGYSPTITTAVWVGNNNNDSMTQSSVVLAGPIWNSFMNYALPKFPKENFKEPLPENKEKQRLMLDGVEPKEPHSILHFVNKKDPLAGAPENPEKDQLYYHFEYGIMSYLGLPLTTSAREFLNKF